MATRRRKSRKSRRSCKYGKLKRKSGRRRCRKSRKKRSKKCKYGKLKRKTKRRRCKKKRNSRRKYNFFGDIFYDSIKNSISERVLGGKSETCRRTESGDYRCVDGKGNVTEK